jgi:hypothetical protein
MSEMLAEAAEIGGVKLLAIVDDAYDPPRGTELTEDAFNRFVLSLEDDPPRLVPLSAASDLVEADLDDWESFTAKGALVNRLWDLSVGVVAEPAMTDSATESLEILFSDVSQDRISKLQQLRPLEKLLAGTNTQLMKLGADPEPSIVAKADVVFLDLFLSDDVPPNPEPGEIPRSVLDKARERAMRYVQAVWQETATDLKAVPPAFILISSLGTQQVATNFRKRTSQTASRFRFVQKKSIKQGDPQVLLAIAEILRTCRASALIDPIRKSLPIVVEDAQKWVADRLVELDIADFARLFDLSLQSEGQPIDDYVKEVVAGALAERVICAFSDRVPTIERPNPFADVQIEFVQTPSNAMAELYNATKITTDRGYRGPDGTYPLSGDLYIEGELPKQATTSLNGRRIGAVMTPICDLMSRAGGDPAATSVLMLQGTLGPTHHQDDPDPQTISLDGRFYEVAWEMKRPQALPLKDLRKDVRLKNRVWLGRLKAEHFFALQSKYLASFARVGLLKAPAIFESLAGRICVREGGELVELATFDAKSGCAFKSPDRKKDATRQPLFFTGAFLDQFRAALQAAATSPQRSEETRAKAQGLLDRMGQLIQMVKRRQPQSHSINDYLRVDLLEARGSAVPNSPNGLILVVLKP